MVALRLSVSPRPQGPPSAPPVRPCAAGRRDRRNPERGRKARQAPSSDRGSRRPRLSSPRGGSAEAFRLRGSRHGTLLGPRPSRREYPPPETLANHDAHQYASQSPFLGPRRHNRTRSVLDAAERTKIDVWSGETQEQPGGLAIIARHLDAHDTRGGRSSRMRRTITCASSPSPSEDSSPAAATRD
jgi:hypothetical protein